MLTEIVEILELRNTAEHILDNGMLLRAVSLSRLRPRCLTPASDVLDGQISPRPQEAGSEISAWHGEHVPWTVVRVTAHGCSLREGSECSARLAAMKVETERLVLESITPELASRIVSGKRHSSDRWHAEYPFEDELDPLRSLAAGPAPDPFFTMYLIRRKSDELAVGGFGFRGRPDTFGRVEFGYGLVPAARGVGLATEAVRAALKVAVTHGARVAAADTELSNDASRRVLEKAGLIETHRQKGFVFFSCPLFDARKL